MFKIIAKIIDDNVNDEACSRASMRFILGFLAGMLPTLAIAYNQASVSGEGLDWGLMLSGGVLGGLVCVYLSGKELKDVFFHGVTAPVIVAAAVVGSQKVYDEGKQSGKKEGVKEAIAQGDRRLVAGAAPIEEGDEIVAGFLKEHGPDSEWNSLNLWTLKGERLDASAYLPWHEFKQKYVESGGKGEPVTVAYPMKSRQGVKLVPGQSFVILNASRDEENPLKIRVKIAPVK